MGTTYISDRLNSENQEITIALDHVYVTISDEAKMTTKKLENSATDHMPILVSFKIEERPKPYQTRKPLIDKRSFKDFNKTRWIDALRNQDWSGASSTDEIEIKTEVFDGSWE